MTRLFPLSSRAALGSAARRWLEGERWEEATPRRASTVMLMRDGARAAEVFMLRRVAGMAFAPNSMVFPGGGVDARDGDPGLPWSGPPAKEWAGRMGCSAAEAQMHVAAGVREVFEECGVLLASETPDGRVADVSDPPWQTIRDRLINHEVSLGQVLSEAGLVLRADLLGVKAHWLTPSFEPRRFDTWFFAALIPEHQLPDGNTSEADHSAWVEPMVILDEHEAGTAILLPPTIACLERVRDVGSAAEFVTDTEDLPLILPEVVETTDGLALRID